MTNASRTLRRDALDIWRAGVDAADPEGLVTSVLHVEGGAIGVGASTYPLATVARIVVVGAGKAGAAMARGVEYALAGAVLDTRVEGLVAVRDDDVAPLQRIALVGTRSGPANRPTPAGVEAARRIEALVRSLVPGDLLLALFSGGGSALLPAPVPGVSLGDKRDTVQALQDAGATITEVNTVRRHLSVLKGGRLARAASGATVAGLLLSDVIGDAPAAIASGPTAPDPSSFADAREVLRLHGVAAPTSVEKVLDEGVAGRIPDTPDVLPASVTNVVIGSNQTAVDGARREADRRGYRVLDLGSLDEPDAERTVRLLAGLVRSIRDRNEPIGPPACILCGGENVLRLSASPGRGGRNQDLALRLVRELGDLRRVAIVCGGTDGEDGPTDAAGAVLDAATVERLGTEALAQALADHDAYPLLDTAGALLRTGRTGTNVADLRVLLVG